MLIGQVPTRTDGPYSRSGPSPVDRKSGSRGEHMIGIDVTPHGIAMTAPAPTAAPAARPRRSYRRWAWIGGFVLLVIADAFGFLYVVEWQLERELEQIYREFGCRGPALAPGRPAGPSTARAGRTSVMQRCRWEKSAWPCRFRRIKGVRPIPMPVARLRSCNDRQGFHYFRPATRNPVNALKNRLDLSRPARCSIQAFPSSGVTAPFSMAFSTDVPPKHRQGQGWEST